MDAFSIISSCAAVAGVVYAFRADARAAEAQSMTREAHRIAKDAHSMAKRERDREVQRSRLLMEVYQRAARGNRTTGIIGFVLDSSLSEAEREIALSLKGDPRVLDVTVDTDGCPRIWVDASGFPRLQH